MKLTLIAKIANLDIFDAVESFFRKDPRFLVEKGAAGIYFDNKDYTEDGLLIFSSHGLEFLGDDETMFSSVLASQLAVSLIELVKEVNAGDLGKLPEVADMITTFRRINEQNGDVWVPDDSLDPNRYRSE